MVRRPEEEKRARNNSRHREGKDEDRALHGNLDKQIMCPMFIPGAFIVTKSLIRSPSGHQVPALWRRGTGFQPVRFGYAEPGCSVEPNILGRSLVWTAAALCRFRAASLLAPTSRRRIPFFHQRNSLRRETGASAAGCGEEKRQGAAAVQSAAHPNVQT